LNGSRLRRYDFLFGSDACLIAAGDQTGIASK
jgi:hypothetical protein